MKLLILLVCFVAVNGASDYEQWQNFKVKFSRSHTLAEDEFRFEIFQNNLRKIEKHNARYEKGQVSYFLKVTEFADWTAEEFQMILGAQSITDVNVETIGTFKRDLNFTRPNTIDWRKENVVTAVKNQLNCGACYAFSSTGALEGQLAIHRNQLISLSEQELISCADNNGCIGGTTESSFRYVLHHGLSSEEQYPYAEIKNDCRSDLSDKPITTIQGYIRVNQNEEEMADAVASVGPISIDLRATKDWGLYGGGVYDDPSCDGLDPNHAVLIVGYDSEAWILKNSWGANWGEDGYMRLVSGKNKCSITNFPCYPVL